MLELTAQKRAPKELIKEGCIPAVFYGAKTPATSIFISVKDFQKVFLQSGEMATIALTTEAGVKNVLVQAIQRHPVKDNIIHVDFYVVEKGQKVHVAIPILFVGEAPVSKIGGNVVKVTYELMVEGESQNLPHDITVDLSVLTGLDSVVLVKDITLPKGVELYHVEANDVIASVTAQNELEMDEIAPVDLSTIEVEKKGKKEEEEVPAE